MLVQFQLSIVAQSFEQENRTQLEMLTLRNTVGMSERRGGLVDTNRTGASAR